LQLLQCGFCLFYPVLVFLVERERGCSRSFFKTIIMDKNKNLIPNFDKYESLDKYIEADKKDLDLTANEKFDKVITIKVSAETKEMWEQLCDNWGEVLGYDNKAKVFEFAMVECLNVPIASLGGYNHEGYDMDN